MIYSSCACWSHSEGTFSPPSLPLGSGMQLVLTPHPHHTHIPEPLWKPHPYPKSACSAPPGAGLLWSPATSSARCERPSSMARLCFSPKAFTTVCPCIKLFICLSYPSFLTTVRDWGQFLSVPLPVPDMAFECTPSVNRYLLSTYWALAERRGSKPQNVLTTLRLPFCTPFPRAQQLGRGQ